MKNHKKNNKIVVLTHPAKLYLSVIMSKKEEDVIELSCKDWSKDKSRYLVKTLIESNRYEWKLKNITKEENGISVFTMGKAKRKNYKITKKDADMIKEYDKMPYDECKEDEIVSALKKYVIKILCKFRKVENEDFNEVILRMGNELEMLRENANK